MAKVKFFFEKNAKPWLENAYNLEGYNYPVAYHRQRILKKIISPFKKKLKIIDLGCGGGNNAIMLAKLGHELIGIDESLNMINIAKKNLSRCNQKIKKQVKFFNISILDNKIKNEKFDICIAMGLIGYLDKDADLFKIAKNITKKNGLFIVSCRNKLFNLQSLSFRTINEIKKKNYNKLFKEITELYGKIPLKDVNNFIKQINLTTKKIQTNYNKKSRNSISPGNRLHNFKKYKPFNEPRQHSPMQIKSLAKKFHFLIVNYYGVHPHLIDPNLNKLLPPMLFNILNDILNPLEHLPISLSWSSAFIGVFKKTK